MKKFYGLMFVVLLLVGCELDLESMETSAVATYAEEDILQEEIDLADFLRSNYAGTEWLATIDGLGMKQESNGKMILGVRTKQREDYLLSQLAFMDWIWNEAVLVFDELWYTHDGEVVIRVKTHSGSSE